MLQYCSSSNFWSSTRSRLVMSQSPSTSTQRLAEKRPDAPEAVVGQVSSPTRLFR